MWNWLSSLGSAASEYASAAGSTIADAASTAGSAVADVGSAAWDYLKSLSQEVSPDASIGQKIGHALGRELFSGGDGNQTAY